MTRETSVPERHRAEADSELRCAIAVISDHRFELHWGEGASLDSLEDESGDEASTLVEEAGHEVVFRMVLPDHSGMISSALDYLVDRYDPDFILTIGSTGISPRDVAVGAVRSLLDREIEGFGELFRRRSVERQRDLGAAAILTGALAGVRDRTVIFSLPGSPQAVKIGTEIALDEIGHMVHMLRGEH